ncbi:MAG: FG-GAP repeat protein [Alphaproteobacteria bacterium]|nr:FG-GAP repeat protein [Alphaproteobacteria bacterium]
MSVRPAGRGVALAFVVVGVAVASGRASTPSTVPATDVRAGAAVETPHAPTAWHAAVARTLARDAADVQRGGDGLWVRHAGGLAMRLDDDGVAHLVLGADDAPVARMATVAVSQGDVPAPLSPATVAVGPCRAGTGPSCVHRADADQGAVVSWWRHAPAGIEQGWTVPSPRGAGPLRLDVRVDGARTSSIDGTLHVGDPVHGLVADAASAWDADGVALAVREEVTDDGFALVVDVDDARWPVTVDPVWRPWSGLIRDLQPSSAFGRAVALAGDVNGDGFADALVGAPAFDGAAQAQGRVYLFLGGPAGLATTPAQTWTGLGAGDALGQTVVWAGDLDGDGHVDAAFGAPGGGTGLREGAVWVLHGTGAGLEATPRALLLGTGADRYAGTLLAPAGDVDGDGYDDLLVGSHVQLRTRRNDEVLLFRGSPTGLDPAAATRLDLGAGTGKARFAGVGDIDGDGYDDVAVGAFGGPSGGRLELYRGGPTGPDVVPSSTTSLGVRSHAITGADVDGDGFADVVVANEQRLQVFRGSAAGLVAPPEVVPVALYPAITTLAGGADVDGDGYGDLLVAGAGERNGGQGEVLLLRGTAAGLDPTPAAFWEGDAWQVHLGDALALGDVDGDGLSDALLGGPGDVAADTGFGFDPESGSPGVAWLVRGAIGGPRHRHATFPSAWASDAAVVVDLDQDGRGDLVTARGLPSFRAELVVQRGTATGFDARELTRPLATTAGIRWWPASLDGCDVDGDGLADLVGVDPREVTASSGSYTGLLAVLRGGPSGPGGPLVALDGGTPAQAHVAVTCAGDLDGDGDSELVVQDVQGGAGHLWLWWGGSPPVPSGLELDGCTGGCPLADGTLLGHGMDLDGDGFDDLALGTAGTATVRVWRGGPTFRPDLPDQLVTPTGLGTGFGQAVRAAGDVDGDGFADLLVSGTSGGGGALYLLHGDASGVDPVPDRLLDAPLGSEVLHGAFAGLGDVDGDGLDDVVVAPSWAPRDAVVHPRPGIAVLRGTPQGLARRPWWIGPVGLTVSRVLPVGDVDGDGHADAAFLVGFAEDGLNPWGTASQGYLFRGTSTGLVQVPAR